MPETFVHLRGLRAHSELGNILHYAAKMQILLEFLQQC